MSAPVLKVGDVAVQVERLFGELRHEIRRVVIVRETPTQWIDDLGDRWRKSDGRSNARIGCGMYTRHLMTVPAFEAEMARRFS